MLKTVICGGYIIYHLEFKRQPERRVWFHKNLEIHKEGGNGNLWKGFIQNRYCNMEITKDILKNNFSKLERGLKVTWSGLR